MTTGERIRARRKELGITADILADKIGVSRSTVFRYENGYIEKLPMNILIPIASALQTTVGYLMGWDMVPSPWEDVFRNRIAEYLQNANVLDLKVAGIDKDYVLWDIVETKRELSLEEACNIADQLGLSIDHLVGRSGFDSSTKKPATISDDGLTASTLAKKAEILKMLDDVPDDKLDKFKAILQAAIDAVK